MYNREVRMACPLKLIVLFVFKFCIFGIVECANNKDVISHCIDKKPCIGTYADIYNALALGENSFNIRSALYPAKKPSSVLVFVNVYGPNGTQSPKSNACKYTWSTNCLFVALPAAFLQVMSFGSIIVSPRTQHLNLTLPSFCCNVSEDKREKMIEDVIVELQDLAVSPAIPDPRLNTAECVIKDHDPKIMDTGRSGLIYLILFCSFISVLLLGPFLAYFILEYLKGYDEETSRFCCWEEKPVVRAADLTVVVLLLIEIAIILYSYVKGCNTGLPMIFMLIITAEGPAIVFILKLKKYIRGYNGNQGGNGGNLGPHGRVRDTITKISAFFRSSFYYIWVNLALYHFFWLVIGIMITPTWGLTVSLVILVFIIVFFFALWHLFKQANFQACMFSGCCFFGFCCAAVVPILAGRSFYGRETADDIIKVVLLYIITALVTLKKKFDELRTSIRDENPGPIPDMVEPPVPDAVNEFQLQ